jgi:hypothetical protein
MCGCCDKFKQTQMGNCWNPRPKAFTFVVMGMYVIAMVWYVVAISASLIKLVRASLCIRRNQGCQAISNVDVAIWLYSFRLFIHILEFLAFMIFFTFKLLVPDVNQIQSDAQCCCFLEDKQFGCCIRWAFNISWISLIILGILICVNFILTAVRKMVCLAECPSTFDLADFLPLLSILLVLLGQYLKVAKDTDPNVQSNDVEMQVRCCTTEHNPSPSM